MREESGGGNWGGGEEGVGSYGGEDTQSNGSGLSGS